MSSTPPFHTSNLTYAIRNANDTIYGPPPYLQSASPLNSNTQMPLPNQLGPHTHTSTPIHYNTMQTKTPQLDVNNGQGQGHTPQMLPLGQPDFSNLGLILNDIQNKLTNLNLLDDIVDIARNELEEKIKQTHESFLDQQTRAMKYNLIFESIAQVIPDATTNENTEAVLKEFLKNEMNIDTQVAFHNVHRLKPRRDRRPPSIIAKFVYHSDKEMVINAARITLVRKPCKVYQQYPQEISDRRRELVPIMKQL